MKKILASALLITSSVIASQASAATMKCAVGQTFNKNHCDTIVWNQQTTNARFYIVGTEKPFSTILWDDATSSCNRQSLNCNVTIRSYRSYAASATILYQDGTWERVSSSARFEDGR